MAEHSTRTYGISVVFEDLDGMRITEIPDRKENEKDFIDRYIICDTCKEIYKRRNIAGSRFCNISDRDHSWDALAMKLQVPYLFKCHAGVSNFLIPIIIGGSVVGNVFGGQFFIQRDQSSGKTDQKNIADEGWKNRMKGNIYNRWDKEGWLDDVNGNKEY